MGERADFIEETKYYHVDKFFKEAYDDYIEPIALGKLNPLRTSIKAEMNLFKGFLPTDQTVIAARSGMGKTSRMIHLIKDFFDVKINPLFKDKIVVLYDSWEISGWRNATKFISLDKEMSVQEILDWDNRLNAETLLGIKEMLGMFKDNLFFISEMPDTPKKWYVNKKKAQIQYPDHLIVNIVDHTRLITNENKQTEEQLLTDLMKTSQIQRKDLKQINFILSQMNRSIEQNTAQSEEIGQRLPQDSHIWGADSVFQCSDNVIALHRPGKYNLQHFKYKGNDYATGITNDSSIDNLMIEVVLKQRNGETGVLFLEHQLKWNKFKDADLNKIKNVKNQSGLSLDGLDKKERIRKDLNSW